jgi:iron(III) transport system permease protein
MKQRRPAAFALTLLLIALLSGLLLWPLAESLEGALTDQHGALTLQNLALVFQNAAYRDGLVNALAVAVVGTVLSCLIGLPLAFLSEYAHPGKRLLMALVPLPLMVPPFVSAIGIKQLLGQYGSLNAVLIDLGLLDAGEPIDWLRNGRFWVVCILNAIHLYPILYFNVTAALSNVSPDLEEAALNLGANRVRALFRVTLPLIMPSVFASVTIMLIWGLTELGTPLICDYTEITSVQIFSGLKELDRNPFVYALVTIVLLVTAGMYLLVRAVLGRSQRGLASKGNSRPRVKRLRPPAAALASVFAFGIVFMSALPNLAVLLVAFADDWYRTVLPSSFSLSHIQAALGHEMVVPSIANSLRYVSLAMCLNLAIGLCAAYVIVRTDFKLKHALDAVVMLPLAIPGLVMAFGYLAISREGRPLAMLNPVRDPTILLVIAYAVRRLPFMVRSAEAGLRQINIALEEAAASLGASPLRVFRRVTLPLLYPHLLAGGVFAFALSMLEVSDSLVLAQKQGTFPITKAIYELFQLLGDGRFVAAALGLWAMLFLWASISFARSLLGRRFGNMFRL